MKLLVFAHTPPPHHGQSHMVELMLKGLGGDRRKFRTRTISAGGHQEIECYHVNARLSRKLEEIGDFRISKFLLLLGYCLQAIWCRFRYGVTTFYYIPAPGKPSALYRDWLVLSFCRPFFKHLVLHWHASGLGKWLETTTRPRSRALTYRVAGRADLSIVLSNYGRADAEKLYPLRVAIVGNGIPDPCPNFTAEVLPRRIARLQARRLLMAGKPITPELAGAAGPDAGTFNILFLGHCTREKGLFDAVRGAIEARSKLPCGSITLKLVVAGTFVDSEEELEFKALGDTQARGVVEYVGFVEGEAKKRCLMSADAFCFPSHIESFGLVLAEAMAFGLPIVTARAGAVPEVMGPDYRGLVDPRRPDQIADALVEMILDASFEAARKHFETRFTVRQHVSQLAAALKSMETAPRGQFSRPYLVPLNTAPLTLATPVPEHKNGS